MPLESARLWLLPWEPSDIDAFRPIATDPEVMRYITGGVPWSDPRIADFIGRQIAQWNQRGYCRWKLVDKAGGGVVGFCGAGKWRDLPDAEIGWWLGRSWWGRGLATEAARTALADLFGRVRLERVVSVAMPENVASLRVMQKLGLRLETEFDVDGMRLVRYSLARAEYEVRSDTSAVR